MNHLTQAPTLQSAKTHENVLSLTWSDGKSSSFHYLWLRDNCPTALHSETQERIFDQLSVTSDIYPLSYGVEPGALTINWSEGDHQISSVVSGYANTPIR